MMGDLVYYTEEFGFIPNKISLNILEHRKEVDSSIRKTILVTSTQDMLDFGKLLEGKSLVKRKRKVPISAVQSNREKGFKLSDFQEAELMGLGD